VSFGESKPAVQGHDESAWKWNRRVEFSAIR
jgi:outer membrane protein OmpA-like peptidoglycan-associated protein